MTFYVPLGATLFQLLPPRGRKCALLLAPFSASQGEGRRFEPGLALQTSISLPIACRIAPGGVGGLLCRGDVRVPFRAAEIAAFVALDSSGLSILG